MIDKLYYSTVSDPLLSVLQTIMKAKPFEPFRMVGGTALSLQRGHRLSVDIDMFADSPYGSLDFSVIEKYLESTFPYMRLDSHGVAGLGKSYMVGPDRMQSVKLDVFYTDQFIRPALILDGIRMIPVEEIIAMKLDIFSRGGRKKDFWDIHELIEDYPFDTMLALHEERYPYVHDAKAIKNNFTDFTRAERDYDPTCLRGKHWELIKLDMMDFVKGK